MNPDTGHLVDLKSPQFRLGNLLDKGYEELPERLQHAARTKLRGRPEAHVQLNSGSQLARWAKKRRKNRRRNKIAKQSRRANR